MKKLLTLLICSMLLWACGSDNDDPATGGGNGGGTTGGKGVTTQLGKTTTPIAASEWKGESVEGTIISLLGDWILTHENGTATNRFLAYRFVRGHGWYSILNKPAVGEDPNFTNPIYYSYNNTQIKDVNGIIYTYKTSADLSTMTLFDGSNTWAFKKYDNNGVWTWKGDWNDPKTSPYYAVYNGKYNPVKGEWKLITNSQDIYYKFDDNFGLYRKILYNNVSYNKVDYTFLSGYNINDIGLYTTQYDFLGYQNHKYWIEGDILYIQGVYYPNTLKDIARLTRIN